MAKQLCVLVVLLFVGVGCGGGGSAASKLDGNWVFTSPDGVSFGVTFTPADDTYVASKIVVTGTGQNSGSANVQVETGRFAVSGDKLTTTPSQWTCPGPDPIDTVTFSFSGPNLELSDPIGFGTYAPNNAPPSITVTVTYGCFDSDGAFAARPLAPVTN